MVPSHPSRNQYQQPTHRRIPTQPGGTFPLEVHGKNVNGCSSVRLVVTVTATPQNYQETCYQSNNGQLNFASTVCLMGR